jgi:hypothetical protein
MKIKIIAGNLELNAELYNTPTAIRISRALPLEGKISRWGKELYFPVPLKIKREAEAREKLKPGEIAYWPEGKMFCIFWGPTPASSTDGIPTAAAPVNVFGRISNSNLDLLNGIRENTLIRVTAHLDHGE